MKLFVLKLIELYKRYLSPGRYGIKICRFEPSCSRYSYAAISKYGLCKGGLLALYRLLRCNPFFRGGYDPLK